MDPENDPIAPAVQATEPTAQVPNWTANDNPDDGTFIDRRDSFLRTHAVADRSYDEVKANWDRHFPGIQAPSADTYATWQERGPRERLLDRVRAQAAIDEPTTSWLPHALAFPRDIATGYRYGVAKERFDAGNPTGEDYGVMAHYELEQERRAQRQQTWAGFAAVRAMEAPSQLAGFMLGGAATEAVAPALGMAGGGLGMAAARLPLQAALTPNIGLQGLIQRNIESGRDPLDLRNAPAALAHGALQMAAYELSGRAIGRIAPKAGMLGRALGAGAAGPITQQAADMTGYMLGLQTRYGSLQDAFEQKWGDVGKEVVNDILTNGLFSLTHGPGADRKGAAPGTPAGEGASGTGGPPPGLEPGGAAPQPPGGLPPKGRPIFDSFVDALNHLHGQGFSPRSAMGTLRGVTAQIKAEWQAGSSREDVAKLFDQYADGPVKRFAMTLVDQFPSKPQTPPPTPGAPQAQPGAPPDQGPKPYQEAEFTVSGQKPGVPTPEAAPPAEPSPQPDLFNRPVPSESAKLAEEPAKEGEGIWRVPDYKNPTNSFDAAMKELVSGPRGRVFGSRDKAVNDSFHTAGTVQFELGKQAAPGEGKDAMIEWGQPLWQHPELKAVRFKGDAASEEFGRLKGLIDDANLERRKSGMEPIAVEASEGKIPELTADQRREKLADLEQRARSGESVSFDQIFKAADLNAEERAAFSAFHPAMGNKTLRMIAADMGMSRETVRKRINTALDKMGLPPEYKNRLVAEAQAEVEQDKIRDGQINDPGEVKQSGPKVHQAADREQRRLNQWGRWLSKNEGRLNEQDQASIAERIRRGETAPGYGRKVAERPAGEPAPVRHPESALPFGAPAVAPANAGAGPLAAGGAVGAPADASAAQAAGHGMTPEQLAAADQKARQIAEKQMPNKPMLPFERHWRKQAADNNVNYDDLKQAAGQNLEISRHAVDEHNEIVRRAMQDIDAAYRRRAVVQGKSGLEVTGFNWASVRALAGQDENSVYGLDDVAQNLAEVFSRPDLNPEKLFDMLQEGLRQPMSAWQAHEKALGDALDAREVERAKKEADRGGWSQRAAEKALRDGEKDGEAEAFNDEGDASEAGHVGDVGGFDPAEFGGPHGTPESLDDAIGKSFLDASRDFIAGESGTLWLPSNSPALRAAARQFRRALGYLNDALGRLSGRMFPATTKLNAAAGESMARYATLKTYVRLASEHYLDRILGNGHREQDRMIAGAVLTERRLRYMRQHFRSEANNARMLNQQYAAAAMHAPNPADQFRLRRESLRQLRRSRVFDKFANEVVSIIGAPNSPLKSIGQYRAYLGTQRMQNIIKTWADEFVPVMDANFRLAQGMGVTDPIDSKTQIPGQPINIKALRPDEPDPKSGIRVGERPGELRNPKARLLRFSKSARGNAEGYDIDLKNIIDNTLSHGVSVARKADMLRKLYEAGIGVWRRPGEGALFGPDERPGREIPGIAPLPGTQTAMRQQTSMYVHPDAYQEARLALAVDEPGQWVKNVNVAMSLPTAAALTSMVDAASHGFNLATSVFAPGANPVNLGKAIYGRLRKDQGFRDRMLKIASIGATKSHELETGGGIVQTLDRAATALGKPLPSFVKFGDPTYWLTKGSGAVLRLWDEATRYMLDKAFDHLVSTGAQADTETGRRDFINMHAGQYNRQAQNGFIALLRATGIGPFATPASQMSINAVRRLFMGGGLGKGVAGTARMTIEGWARLFGMLGAGFVSNMLLWGRPDGDEDVPFGAIKVGVSPDGRSRYIDTPASLAARRGLRSLGFLAFIDDAHKGQITGSTQDTALSQIQHTAMHPAMGPGVQAGYMAITGRNAFGHRVAEKPGPGEPEWPMNVKAAALTFNPVVSALTGAGHGVHGEDVDWFERLNDLLGPFGVKTAPRRR
jgi:hypothetical protein